MTRSVEEMFYNGFRIEGEFGLAEEAVRLMNEGKIEIFVFGSRYYGRCLDTIRSYGQTYISSAYAKDGATP